ncbi:MAG: AMP-binding protein [Deltaproteobacteria bacterium]|jgi:acyl-CoA synthetase (AMP-forming)/AMP-acid ligase II|nr:AMP-binding protein [Deltaproteobacteria bacterium]
MPIIEKNIFNIASLISEAARKNPSGIATLSRVGADCLSRTTLSFKELDDDSSQLASGLINMDLKAGSKVALLVPYGPDFHIIVFAVFKAGLIPVMVDPGMGAKRFLECLGTAGPKALIGSPKAQFLSLIFKGHFKELTLRVTLGRRWGWGGETVKNLLEGKGPTHHMVETPEDSTAAILFTSGATGPAKGVIYTHAMFRAQVELIRENFALQEGDRDLVTFPLFGLFTPALGVTAVMPSMNPTLPALADPKKLVTAILEDKASSLFASPVLLSNLANYLKENKVKLKGLKTVICAGAPVQPQLALRVKESLEPEALVFTPYGATEAMPLTRIEVHEIQETRGMSEQGFGMCLGRPVTGHDILILPISEKKIESFKETDLLPQGEVGELIATGPVVALSYYELPQADALSIVKGPEGKLWRRMGDLGWKDALGRVWFCGRKNQRVTTPKGVLFTISCESVFNNHPLVRRSALVGVGDPGSQIPVIVLETSKKLDNSRWESLTKELSTLAKANPRTRDIKDFLSHNDFPVDIRHNAKIAREKLALWAKSKLAKK